MSLSHLQAEKQPEHRQLSDRIFCRPPPDDVVAKHTGTGVVLCTAPQHTGGAASDFFPLTCFGSPRS